MDKKQKGGKKIRREMEKKLCNGKTGTSWYTPGIRKRERKITRRLPRTTAKVQNAASDKFRKDDTLRRNTKDI